MKTLHKLLNRLGKNGKSIKSLCRFCNFNFLLKFRSSDFVCFERLSDEQDMKLRRKNDSTALLGSGDFDLNMKSKIGAKLEEFENKMAEMPNCSLQTSFLNIQWRTLALPLKSPVSV